MDERKNQQGGIEKRVKEVMQQQNYRASTQNELARILGLKTEKKSELRRVIANLVKAGEVIQGRHNRYELRRKRSNLLTGRIRAFPKGHGLFKADLGDENNKKEADQLKNIDSVFIPPRKMNTAMNGDLVLIELEKYRKPVWQKHRDKGKRPHQKRERPPQNPDELTGCVIRVLERSGGLMVGTLQKVKGRYYLENDDPKQPPEVIVTDAGSAKAGQKVGVTLTQWANQNERPKGKVTKILGWPHDAGIDIVSIILRNGLRTEFPPEVTKEAENISEQIPPKELERREDWRKKLVITIDPASARDHDDAVWVQKHEDGWKLGVHIADVSHYVRPGSPIDKEAFARGNSTYLPDRVLPMIPEKLSNGICSLRPNEDRLTKAIELTLDPLGRIKKSRFFDAVICSQAKLSYEEAQTVLKGGEIPKNKTFPQAKELKTMLLEAWQLASVLRKRRFEQGALDLDMADTRLCFDEKGNTTGYTVEEYNESHQLIEEFMLIANESVARKLQNQQKPAIYRVHQKPDDKKLQEYADAATLYGYKPGDLTNRKHIQKLLKQAQGTPEEHAIKLGLLKSMKRAYYSNEGLGHYGLAKSHYAHFTSPIRRYADLIVHRALQGLLENKGSQKAPSPQKQECSRAADHISQTERMSANAEDEAKRLKLLQWLERGRRAKPSPTFNAVVTDVRTMGVFVEIIEMGQRGLVRYDLMGGGRWQYRDYRKEFVSSSGKRIGLGSEVQVQVQSVDFVEQRVDFKIIGHIKEKTS